MGAAGAGGQQRADRRAAGDRRAARRLRPAAHAPARRGLLDRRGPVGRDRRPAARATSPACCARTARRRSTTCCCNLWLARRRALGGERARAVRRLSRALCVPVAFWAGWTLFGRRTAWIAALLAAVNPFLTQYAQEGRMYALVALLGLMSLTCWLQAFTTDADGRAARAGDRLRGRVRGDALHAQLGAVLRRGDGARVARAAVARARRRARAAAAHRPARLRRRRAALRAVDPEHALPGRPHGRAVVQGAVAGRARLRARADPRRGRRGRGLPRRRRAASSRCCAPAAPRARAGAALLGDRRAHDRAGLDRLAALARVGQPLPRRGRRAVPAAGRRRLRARRPARARRPRARRRAVGDRRRAGGEEQRARRSRRRSRRRCGPATSSSRRSPSRSRCSTTTCPTGCATRR